MKTFLQNLAKTILLLTAICNLQFANAQTQIGADINGEAIYNQSGIVSISANGNIVAIGAVSNYGSGTNSGHVRVYQNIAGTWSQIGADINGESAYDRSGCSVSLSANGDILAIGAVNNYGSDSSSGHVRVYQNIAGTWSKIGADIDGKAWNNESGWSVSLSEDGSIVAIGAPGNSDNGENSGHVRIYKNIAGTWTQIGADINGEAAGDRSGISVSLSSDGSVIAIGAIYNDGNGINSGQVRIYKNITGTWTQIGIDINGESTKDEFGRSVSLSSDGSTVAIGAPENNGNGFSSGQVRVYQNTSDNWIQIGGDIDGEAVDDDSGFCVSLSSNGSIVAIGASGNDGNTGHVRIYKNNAGSWVQIGTDINGEASIDFSGNSISLSSDGSSVAIGAPLNDDGNNYDAGHVRVYDLSALLSSNSFVQSNFSIYPNPTSGIINISLQENLQLEKVNIYNTLGQMVKTEKQNQINVSTLSKGSYFMEVITNQGKATKGFIVD